MTLTKKVLYIEDNKEIGTWVKEELENEIFRLSGCFQGTALKK